MEKVKKKKCFTDIAVTARHSMSDGMLHVGSYSFTKASQDPLQKSKIQVKKCVCVCVGHILLSLSRL
jgi:hypothetical protein